MNDIFELIDESVKHAFKDSDFVKSIPCRVVTIYNQSQVTVKTITDETLYTVPNKSGTTLSVGEDVQVFYKGNILTEKTAYIGAALTNVHTDFTCVNGVFRVEDAFETEVIISTINVCATRNTLTLLYMNLVTATVFKTTTTIKVYVDDVEQSNSFKFTLNADEYNTRSFTMSLFLVEGNHVVKIKAINGYYVNAVTYIYGCDIVALENPSPTIEGYVYETNNDESNLIYYLEEDTQEEVPVGNSNSDVKKLYAVAFNHSDVEEVFIPEGIEEIE